MAKKITYLLGAGASANVIPVVPYMRSRIKEVINSLRTYENKITNPGYYGDLEPEITYNIDVLKKTITELEWLLSESDNYYTIDTLAKKYYLTSQVRNLNRLKECLITYFTIEQYVFFPSNLNEEYQFDKNRVDKRYDSFIATIANKKTPYELVVSLLDVHFELNNEIKIISWNYDIQFEQSLQRFLELNLWYVKSNFQIFPNQESLREPEKIVVKIDNFSMVKLNGNAIWDESIHPTQNHLHTIFDLNTSEKNNDKRLGYYLSAYKKSFFINPQNHSKSPLLTFNFAWENYDGFEDKYIGYNKNLEMAELIASETEILVVIGYSFPIFNREIDNRLFRKMEKLEKVYIQDKDPERIQSTMQNAFEVLQKTKVVDVLGNEATAGRTFNELRSISKVSFQLESNLNQFVIPYELHQ